jgi:hypothetical protein
LYQRGLTDQDSPLEPNDAGKLPTLDQRVDRLAGRAQRLRDFVDREERREAALRVGSPVMCPASIFVSPHILYTYDYSQGSTLVNERKRTYTSGMPDSSEFAVITARVPPEMETQLHRCLKRLNESQPGMHAKLSTIVRMALARGLESLEQELAGKGRK